MSSQHSTHGLEEDPLKFLPEYSIVYEVDRTVDGDQEIGYLGQRGEFPAAVLNKKI